MERNIFVLLSLAAVQAAQSSRSSEWWIIPIGLVASELVNQSAVNRL
jgi:hypothetical protein